MFREVLYTDIREDCLLIDVRSPGEYEEYTIPGAVNVPLFDDEERKIIGTVYKNDSVEEAKRLGVEMVSKRLPLLYEKITKLKQEHRNIAMFCERGGMRSSSVCALFDSLGISITKLKDGYKGYRAQIIELLPKLNEEVSYIVIHGFTGTGKTEVLEKLEQKGYDVLNLEGIANHRGSQLGKVGLERIVSQKSFESKIFEMLRKRKSDVIFIEAESDRIGNIIVPKFIINKMREGRHLLLQSNIELRARRIIEEYMKNEDCDEQLMEGIAKLEKYIGRSRVQELNEKVRKKEYFDVAVELMNKYYDPLYYSSQVRYSYDIVVNSDDVNKACEEIEKWYKCMEGYQQQC
ncbi:MAG: tRNA 2-selenouridine(34) synthase MnmH [Bacillota bacterium]